MAADPSIVATLKELPPKYRSYLLRLHGKKIASSLHKDGKLERLAELIGPNQSLV